MTSAELFDVIIIGCGPTGAMLSAYLSRQSIKHVVLERESDITSDPRGIALDEDGVRLLQGLGFYDKIFTEIAQGMGMFNFIPGGGNLQAPAFLRFNYNTIEGGTGHVGFICHKQPSMEKYLRLAINKDFGQVWSNSTVTAIDEDSDCVYVDYTDVHGKPCKIRSRFLVGADGKTGFTRKKYLEPKGVQMEKNSSFQYEAVWVALNWHLILPTPESHPDFPLWSLGYSKDEVFDLFFPKEFRFICDPERPAVCGRFGLKQDYLWRFEFVVKPGEDGWEMSTSEKTREIIMPFLTHPGSWYGLPNYVIWPSDCIDCVRSRPFSFSARSCNRWSLGRTILLGDAAHVFPPFGGQGIASGFRDAVSLSWRLAIACRDSSKNYDSLFTGWYIERKQQLERSLASTIENGNLCTEPSRIKAWLRNWHLWAIQLIPSWKHSLELGARREGMIKYDWRPGMPFLREYEGGRCFPQVFSASVNGPAPAMPSFTDDAIFAEKKKCLFQVVVLLDDLASLPVVEKDLEDIDTRSGGELNAKEATFIVHGLRNPQPVSAVALTTSNIIRVLTASEYTTTTTIYPENAIHRPTPHCYNPNRIRDDIGHDKVFVILRPDRFVFAACRDRMELERAASLISESLQLLNVHAKDEMAKMSS